jgi:hypothetical protein
MPKGMAEVAPTSSMAVSLLSFLLLGGSMVDDFGVLCLFGTLVFRAEDSFARELG